MIERFEPDLSPAEEASVRDFMQSLAAAPLGPNLAVPNLPDARALWLRAQLIRRWNAESAAQRSLDVMDRVQIIVGAVAAVVLFAWSVPALRTLAL